MPLELREWTDQPSWDSFVGSHDSGHFQQGWGWGEFAIDLGGTIRRLAVVEDGQIQATMSTICHAIRRSPLTQLAVSRGPVLDRPTEELFMLLERGQAEYASRVNALSSKIEPPVAAGDPDWPQLLVGQGYKPLYPPSQPRSTWILDLEPDLDTLLSNMKSKTRYNIRLAEKRGVEVVDGTAENLDDFYKLYIETGQRDGFFILPKQMYARAFEIYWGLGQFRLLLAVYKGKPIAAVTLVHVGSQVWYLYGASTNEHREVMAPHLLQWEAIKWAKSRGAERYDFRGVPDVLAEDQEMYGVYRFKSGFGGRHVTVLETYAKGYREPLFQLWRGYWRSRFFLVSAQRRYKGLPRKPWA